MQRVLASGQSRAEYQKTFTQNGSQREHRNLGPAMFTKCLLSEPAQPRDGFHLHRPSSSQPRPVKPINITGQGITRSEQGIAIMVMVEGGLESVLLKESKVWDSKSSEIRVESNSR